MLSPIVRNSQLYWHPPALNRVLSRSMAVWVTEPNARRIVIKDGKTRPVGRSGVSKQKYRNYVIFGNCKVKRKDSTDALSRQEWEKLAKFSEDDFYHHKGWYVLNKEEVESEIKVAKESLENKINLAETSIKENYDVLKKTEKALELRITDTKTDVLDTLRGETDRKVSTAFSDVFKLQIRDELRAFLPEDLRNDEEFIISLTSVISQKIAPQFLGAIEELEGRITEKIEEFENRLPSREG